MLLVLRELRVWAVITLPFPAVLTMVKLMQVLAELQPELTRTNTEILSEQATLTLAQEAVLADTISELLITVLTREL